MTDRAPRSDAVVNRERIVVAARAALSRSDGSIDDLKMHLVAKAAQVGQGTLYRHFPTRDHLLAQVYRQEMIELTDAVPALLAEHPPMQALIHWLDQVVEYTQVKRGVMAAIGASAWHELYTDQHERLDHAIDRLLDAGRTSGEMRDDVDAADVILLLGALARIPTGEWDRRARTVVSMIADGLRTR